VSGWLERRRRAEMTRRAEVMRLAPVRVRFRAALAADDGDVRVCASVGPQGQVVALWSAAADQSALTPATEQPGWATFPDPVATRPVPVRVTVHDPGPVTVARIRGLRVAHVTVQPLPSGRFLVVGARSRWRRDGPDRNAVIYGSDGHVVAEAVLGDGIEHVFATSDGHIWAGYFDEGVYGNFGWGTPDSDAPVGACGLARFTPDLQLDWRYPSHVDRPWGAISDCYALNVADTDVWACYYTAWPIVRIRGGNVSSWHNTVTAARAIAVHDARVALYGGYAPDRDRLVAGELSPGGLQVTGEYRVVLPDGAPIPARTQVIGRGTCLHFLTGTSWYQLTVPDVPVAPASA
jgi:hypothetical protein